MKGLQGFIDVQADTPAHIEEWIVRNVNKLKCGSGAYVLQTSNARLIIAQLFSASKDNMNLCVSMCVGLAGYEAMHRRWLTETSTCPVFAEN